MNRHFVASVVILVCLCYITANSYACEPLDIIIWDWIKHMPLDAYSVVKTEIVADVVSGGPVKKWQWSWPSEAYDVLPVFPFETDYSRGRFISTGKYYVYVSAVNYFDGWDSHYANVYVFEMDLDISNGGFVPVNNDDDNGNTTPDKDDPGPVTGEDDLVAISLSYEPSSLYPGYIELKVGYSNNNIRVWTDSTKGNLVIPDGSNYYKRWPVGTQPSTLYVEGVSAGTAELWLLYSSHWNPDTPVYPGGEYNHDSVDVTVVGVDILYCFPHILMYTGDHAADTPTQNCVAYGHPSGGTYSWQCSTTDDGMLGIVSGQNTDTAEVKGVAASSSVLDAKITVTYTLGGKTAQDTRSVTVHRPKYTLAYSGYFDQQYRTKRNYFHPVRDQFGGYLYITGMPCDEVVTCIYGLDENVTSPGATAYHNKENEDTGDYYGDWPGGIAVKDVLGCPTTQMENSKYKQDIYVGGWLTSPTYYIYMQPLEDDPWPCIWKE